MNNHLSATSLAAAQSRSQSRRSIPRETGRVIAQARSIWPPLVRSRAARLSQSLPALVQTLVRRRRAAANRSIHACSRARATAHLLISIFCAHHSAQPFSTASPLSAKAKAVVFPSTTCLGISCIALRCSLHFFGCALSRLRENRSASRRPAVPRTGMADEALNSLTNLLDSVPE